jgi:hypothetical protein
MTEPKIKKKRTLFRKIVNVFLAIFIGIFFLIVLFIGFSQTKTFREFLREKVIELANANLNGKLDIQRIDGTILTSIILRNTLLTMGQDTILAAGKITLETSPLRILLKQIHIRKFEIADAKIELLKDSTGNYNISRLVKPAPKDTTKSEFPFNIRVSSFGLKNVNFKSSTIENKYSTKSYNYLTMDDFRIDSLNLELSAYANISKKDFLINIDGINCTTNLSGFTLKNLSGKLEITEDYAKISDFTVQTKSTDFDLDASLVDLHLFNNFNYKNLKKSPVKLRLTTRIFNFSELSGFIPATNMLKGVITTTVYASGKYGNMKIDKIAIDYLKTHLEGTASVNDLNDPKNLYIKAHLNNSYINQPDIAQLLPDLNFPVYDNLKIKNIEIDYEGRPNNFTAKFKADFPQGNINSDIKLDFSSDKMKYDVLLNTSQLNLSPIIKTSTNINLRAEAKGEGTNPKELVSNIKMNLLQTTFQQYKLDSLQLAANAKGGIVEIKSDALVESVKLKLKGNVDFYDLKNPVYNIYGNVSKLNLNRILKDSTLTSDINFNFELRGKSFDVDEMESKLIFRLDSSRIAQLNVSPTQIILDYEKPSQNTRSIKINSDFADLNIKGEFKLTDVLSVVSYESETITNLIKKKINSINPWALFKDTVKAREFSLAFNPPDSIPKLVNKNINLEYTLLIRDLSKVKTLSGLKEFNIEGKLDGKIINSSEKFEVSSSLHLDRFKMISNDNIVYVSKFDLDFNTGKNNQAVNDKSIFGKLNLTIERIFSGTDIKNISVSFGLENSVLSSKFSAQLDTTLNISYNGKADASGNDLKLSSDEMLIDYKNFIWKNDGKLKAVYNQNYFELQNFRLLRNNSSLDIKGKIFNNGAEELSVEISNFKLDMINSLAGISTNTLSGNINLNGQMRGYLHDPVIDLQFNLDDLVTQGVKLGSLKTNFNYDKKILSADVKFLDTTLTMSNPNFVISGYVPIDLAFVGASERIIKEKPLSLSIKSQSFDLSLFSNLVPMVKNLGGKLTTDLNAGGTFDNLDLIGNMSLVDGNFTLTQNNLPYDLNLNMSLRKSMILLDSFELRNSGKTKYNGKLSGNGTYNFTDNIGELNLRGDLVILSQASKVTMPYLYGDLTIKTDGDWKFNYQQGNSSFEGNVLLKDMNITIPQTQTAYSGGSEYIYRYVVDTTKIDRSEEEFKQVVAINKKYSPIRSLRPRKTSNFNYKVRIKTEGEGVLNLILNQESNQKLRALLEGDLLFESGGIAQGEFDLLEGSELTFFKTFTAEGKIYFERDLTNPRLDITATYRAEHSDSLKSEDVAVKINLEGSIDQLGENLNKNSGNIAVYEGESNIDKNIPSPDKTSADAITFILLGKFLSEMTTGDKAAMSGFLDPKEYTNSALSGVLSAFANKYLGDVVRNVELEQRGNSTRLSVSGKIQKLKYSLGTKTEEFQDITKANLKLEYPFSDNFIIRFERKDPILETISNADKVNEIAIKYKFVF